MKTDFRIGSAITLALLALSLVACSGDGRPLQEAVEINQAELLSVVIKQPENRLADLYVNPGETVNFSIEARNAASELVDISSDDRNWSIVGGETIASIDRDATLFAKTDGLATVQLVLGRFTTQFPVNVRFETLQSIDIQIGTAGTLEPCRPANYRATGMFSLGSTRGLTSVDWRVADATYGRISERDDGSVTLTATNPTTADPAELVLVATAGGVEDRESIVVLDTLESIEITPETLSLQNDDTLSLGATGTYTNDRTFSLTDSVIWGVPEDNGVVTISNTSPEIGVVTAVAVGDSEVTATCGKRAQKAIVVI